MDHAKVAIDILNALNGRKNIQAITHCATRLRFIVKDESKIDYMALDHHPDIKGIYRINGQFQVIIGPGDVDEIYNELIKRSGLPGMTEGDQFFSQNRKKGNLFLQFMSLIADIFVPIIPALIAGGILMALNNVLTTANLFSSQSIVGMYPNLKGVSSFIHMMSAAPYLFLPILIGFSATRRFGGNPYLGAMMGMIMLSPDLSGAYNISHATATNQVNYWHLFGLDVAKQGYQDSVLPVLAVSYILAKIEKYLHKRISKALDFNFTPMLAIILTGFITFLFVGPVMQQVSDSLTNGLMWLYDVTGFVGTFVFGFFYSAIVITGLHQSFPAIETELLANIGKTGGSFILPIASVANVAQAAACFATFFVMKNKKQKGLASSSGITALFGITEPAIFGVNLKLKYPFFCAMIGSGVASIFIGVFHILANTMGPSGILGFICINTPSIVPFIFCLMVSVVIAFSLTLFYGKRSGAKESMFENVNEYVASTVEVRDPVERIAQIETVQDEYIYAPVLGESTGIKEVNDKVFSHEFLGTGAAIIPETGDVVAPCDGLITVTFNTNHALSLKTERGAEILIHIGIDTVNLNGAYFERYVEKNQWVNKGDKLCHFDLDKIQKMGYDPTVVVVITNTEEYATVERIGHNRVSIGDKLIEVMA
ncbi:PTS beta-glucoside transporter subunit IIBCA [Terrilactibacillus sp. BCM23-1]|uniref:protein-N(pi)-phosphohistidine--sucrose phosphotransferase n=1 Tax=Terrilactibacillus tamarindi TaxID=2599694 RepID=A0A6N8CPQ0_9BACI|nr:sucrose-specific PTS transporter subunit IIBC [Terrilactibacillus tamarindi]MTT31127.1 PTS beta-glucoside transporter subunit IIBCA [Terrilactibacillus tamarindi]